MKENLAARDGAQEFVGEVLSVVMDLPTPRALAEKVYRFLLEGELSDRSKKFCAGCGVKSQSQKDHMDGCLAERSVVVGVHAKAAHLRVSASRIVECGCIISTFFKDPAYIDIALGRKTVESSNPAEVLMTEPIMYESEFNLIKLY